MLDKYMHLICNPLNINVLLLLLLLLLSGDV